MFTCGLVLSLLAKVSYGWLLAEELKITNDNDVNEFRHTHHKNRPLILTDYLLKDDFVTAKEKAKVRPFVGNVDSFSGFFTVEPVNKSNLFFWYFPALIEPESAPVVIWLQGGPGESSMYGLFLENGPYILAKSEIRERHYSWTRSMHMVYIDNPVGTGFSFNEKNSGFSDDEVAIGRNLYNALIQFYHVFPEILSNPMFIASESYGGKFAVSLAHKIHNTNPFTTFNINLDGLVLLSAFVDPLNQLNYGEFLLGIGLIDGNQKSEFDMLQNLTIEAIEENDWNEAFNRFTSIIGSGNSIYHKFSGPVNKYNYLKTHSSSTEQVDEFLQKDWVKQEIHVGNMEFRSVERTLDVQESLQQEFTQSVSHWLAEMSNNYQILFINGQLDIITAYPLVSNVVENLDWCGANDFATAERRMLFIGKDLAGYIKTSSPDYCDGSISQVMIRDGGHLLSHDQPRWTYQVVNSFVKSQTP